MSQKADLNDATRRLFVAEAELRAAFAAQGATISQHHGYEGLTGIDAVHRFLIDKYHWLPSQVRALTTDELQLLLAGTEFAAKSRARRRGRTAE